MQQQVRYTILRMAIFLFLVLFALLSAGSCKKNVSTSSTGTITITSTPSGADIFLDDISTGKATPATLHEVKEGSYKIKLTLVGYDDWKGHRNVSENSVVISCDN